MPYKFNPFTGDFDYYEISTGLPGINGTNGRDGITIPAFDGLDAEEPLMIPGQVGPSGINGSNGVNGATVVLLPEDPEEVFPIPGAKGDVGATGATGAAGVTLYLEPDEPQEPLMIPGSAGVNGTNGANGATGPAGSTILPEEVCLEDVPMIPPAVPFPQVHLGAYAPGSFEVPTGFYAIMSGQLQLTGSQYVNVLGTGSLRIT